MCAGKTDLGQLFDRIPSGVGFMPPLILWPGGAQTIGAGEVLVRSSDCGPKKVEATEKGEWKRNRSEARKSARAEARAAALDTCRGNCEEGSTCKYLEAEGKITGPEERQNPQNENEPQFRYEFTSRGACQCE